MNKEITESIFFRQNPDPMWVFDTASLQFLDVNDAALAKYGYTLSEFLSLGIDKIRPAEDLENFHSFLAKPFKVGETSFWRHLTKSGEIIHVSIVGYPITYLNRPARLVYARDVTQLVLLQQQNTELLDLERQYRLEAEASARYFQSLFETIPGKFLVLAPGDFEIVAVSDQYLAATMRTRAELKGKKLFEAFPPAPDDLNAGGMEKLTQSLTRVVSTAVADVMAINRYPIARPVEAGGGFEERYWSIINTPINDSEGEVAYIVHRVEDVTELITSRENEGPASVEALIASQKQVLEMDVMLRSQELKAAQQRAELLSGQLTTALESMSDAFYTLSADWRFTFMNAQAEALLGRSREELLGNVVWHEFEPLRNSTFEHEYRRAVTDKATVRFIEFYPPLQKWFEVNAYPSQESLAVYFRDITEPRLRDEQLRQAQKMELLGKLTGGIAHDFNNLLTVILGNSDILAELLADKPELQRLAQMSAEAADRGAELVSRLLSFARRQTLKPDVLDVRKLVNGMKPLLRRALAESITIEEEHDDALWHIKVDAAQLESAILNIALNSQDAMPQGGQFLIRSRNVSFAETRIVGHAEVPAGDYVLVSMQDTGQGIAAEYMEKVYDPFFTTKEVGKGSGLGLSMVFGFIQQSSGHMDISSRVAEGTVVTLYFPAERHAPAGQEREDSVRSDPPTGTERVLLVEDDELVRNHVNSLLTSLGYRASVAASAPEALALFDADTDFDLLLTDIILPSGMNGRELAEAVSLRKPGIEVLYMSGFTDGTLDREGQLPVHIEFLAKPFKARELAMALRRVLD